MSAASFAVPTRTVVSRHHGILTLGRSLTPCRDTGFALGAVPVTGDGP